MSLFEYLSVAIAIVVSFGVVRLLDGLTHAATREHRYWPHLVWTAVKLLHHFNVWWLLWAARDVSWDYGRFLVQLGAPLILYVQATLLVSSSAQSVEDWRAHYYAVHRRFFALNVLFGFSLQLAAMVTARPEAGWVPAFQEIANGIGVAVVSLVGFFSRSHRVHALLAVVAVMTNVAFVARIYSIPGPLG